MIENEEGRILCRFFQSETQTSNSCRTLDYARDNKSIIYVPMIYAKKKRPFTSCPAAKHQNTVNLGLQTYEKNQ